MKRKMLTQKFYGLVLIIIGFLAFGFAMTGEFEIDSNIVPSVVLWLMGSGLLLSRECWIN